MGVHVGYMLPPQIRLRRRFGRKSSERRAAWRCLGRILIRSGQTVRFSGGRGTSGTSTWPLSKRWSAPSASAELRTSAWREVKTAALRPPGKLHRATSRQPPAIRSDFDHPAEEADPQARHGLCVARSRQLASCCSGSSASAETGRVRRRGGGHTCSLVCTVKCSRGSVHHLRSH